MGQSEVGPTCMEMCWWHACSERGEAIVDEYMGTGLYAAESMSSESKCTSDLRLGL